jgi:dimethylaniline monooxygenase (N-oxide forming)
MTAFSDFPFPDEWPTYLPSGLIGKYLEMYAEHFGLIDHIKFNRTVSSVSLQLDEHGDHTGKWVLMVENSNKRSAGLKRREDSLTIEDSLNNKEGKERGKKMIFDQVIVSTGHVSFCRLNTSTGSQTFRTLRALNYFRVKPCIQIYMYIFYNLPLKKVPYPFKDSYVLIVGSGASGLDIASDLASHAKQVYVSSRSGAWVLPKFGFFGLPTDQIASRALSALPKPVINFAMESMSKVYSGTSSLRPSHALLEGQPTINGEFAEKVGSGKIIVKPNISKFLDSETVQFEDDSEIKVDTVIYCTGYKVDNHFLESNQVLGKEHGSPRLVNLFN